VASTPALFLAEPGQLATDPVVLTGPEGRHAATVQRIEVGEVIDVADGLGTRVRCEVVEVGRDRLVCRARAKSVEAPAAPRITVVQALAKGDRGELAVELMTELGVDEILPVARRVLEGRSLRIPTHLLNAVVEDLQARTPIPGRTRATRVKYAVQVESAPPTIVLFGAQRIPDRWLRYLERGLRARFGFEGTPIRLITRGGEARRAGRGKSRAPQGRGR
jgi:hypothetical protein